MEAKKIIITGSATRIGAAIARSLAEDDVPILLFITMHHHQKQKKLKKNWMILE